jgi:Lon-like ATP-dependent protease
MDDRTLSFDFRTTAEITVAPRLIDRIVGQPHAVETVRIAARQHRYVLLLGEPGTGKSMLAKSLAEELRPRELRDVIARPNPADPMCPRIEPVAAGTGRALRAGEADRGRIVGRSLRMLLWFAAAAAVLVGAYLGNSQASAVPPVLGALAATALWTGAARLAPATTALPKVLIDRTGGGAPFVAADGSQAGALFGDVRHDPYQSGAYATPPHELIEVGAVHRAHGGVLYLDEIGAVSPESQQTLLTAMQERALAITGRSPGSFGTAVRSEPLPCDFILVAAGNAGDLEKLHPALRSRIRGFGYEVWTASDMPDTLDNRDALARFVAAEVAADGRIPHFTRAAVEEIVGVARDRAGAGRLTLRLRELAGLVRAAGDRAATVGAECVQREHVLRAIEWERELSRFAPDAPA